MNIYIKKWYYCLLFKLWNVITKIYCIKIYIIIINMIFKKKFKDVIKKIILSFLY